MFWPTFCGRFSLLLLEFGEIYFEDFGAIYYPPASTETGSIERSEKERDNKLERERESVCVCAGGSEVG